MISTKAHTAPKKLELKIDNINIEYVHFFNFLGLTIDSHLAWENHNINVSNKCLRIIGILNRIKYFVPLNIRLMLYNALILLHLNYCLTAWGYQCNRIIKLQKKAIRTVMIIIILSVYIAPNQSRLLSGALQNMANMYVKILCKNK